ncbi:MAG: CoA transferase, partial [Devosia nanyangense]|nr:CoA transferase [Devosia nanyangense]
MRQGGGKGQFIDLSHRELVSRFIGEQIMEFTMNGRLPKRLGNRHSSM